MKNVPDKIYLNIGEDQDLLGYDVDFTKDLAEVTWCEDRIHESDIEYVKAAPSEQEDKARGENAPTGVAKVVEEMRARQKDQHGACNADVTEGRLRGWIRTIEAAWEGEG